MNLLKHCIWSRINASGSGSGGGTVMTVSWHQCPEAVRRYLAGVDYNGTAYTETEITDYAPTPAVPAANTKPIGKTVDSVTYYNNVPGTAAPFASENMAGTVQPLDRLRWINSYTGNLQTFDAEGNWVATLSQGATGTGGWVWAEDYKSGYIVLPSSYGGNHFAGTVSARICVAYEDIDNIVITKGGGA